MDLNEVILIPTLSPMSGFGNFQDVGFRKTDSDADMHLGKGEGVFQGKTEREKIGRKYENCRIKTWGWKLIHA